MPYMDLLWHRRMLITNCLACTSNLRSNAIHRNIQVAKNRLGYQRTLHESHIAFYYFPLIALCKSKYKRKITKHSCMRPIDSHSSQVDWFKR